MKKKLNIHVISILLPNEISDKHNFLLKSPSINLIRVKLSENQGRTQGFFISNEPIIGVSL